MVQIFIKKDYEEPFKVFAREYTDKETGKVTGIQYFAQWGFIEGDMEGYGTMNEASVYSVFDYVKDVQNIIALRYSFADELSIERQKETKPEEFKEYDDFCEAVKTVVKSINKN